MIGWSTWSLSFDSSLFWMYFKFGFWYELSLESFWGRSILLKGFDFTGPSPWNGKVGSVSLDGDKSDMPVEVLRLVSAEGDIDSDLNPDEMPRRCISSSKAWKVCLEGKRLVLILLLSKELVYECSYDFGAMTGISQSAQLKGTYEALAQLC